MENYEGRQRKEPSCSNDILNLFDLYKGIAFVIYQNGKTVFGSLLWDDIWWSTTKEAYA